MRQSCLCAPNTRSSLRIRTICKRPRIESDHRGRWWCGSSPWNGCGNDTGSGLGVPVDATVLQGVDALMSIVQMPKGVPVATFAVGTPGAINAALFAAAMLANEDAAIREALDRYREAQSAGVPINPFD